MSTFKWPKFDSYITRPPQIEKLLADVGTNKSNILEARIWLKDIKRDFAAMNGVLFKMILSYISHIPYGDLVEKDEDVHI